MLEVSRGNLSMSRNQRLKLHMPGASFLPPPMLCGKMCSYLPGHDDDIIVYNVVVLVSFILRVATAGGSSKEDFVS
jgi:hypothetical protein